MTLPPSTDGHQAAEPPAHDGSAAQDAQDSRRRQRTMTATEKEIDNTINRPGSVKINVTGAFIVDPDASTPRATQGLPDVPGGGGGSPTHHATSDIRLPNHTAVVSHIAVDVSLPSPIASFCLAPADR